MLFFETCLVLKAYEKQETNKKLTNRHSWARNLKNVALQKQNTICKTGACAKCNMHLRF